MARLAQHARSRTVLTICTVVSDNIDPLDTFVSQLEVVELAKVVTCTDGTQHLNWLVLNVT